MASAMNTAVLMSKTLNVNRTTAYRWVSKAGDELSAVAWSGWCIMSLLSGSLSPDDFMLEQ